MNTNKNTITILFASSVEAEKQRFKDIVNIRDLGYVIYWPKNIQEADELLSTLDISLIITDLGFADGAFADWLMLWPRPFILLAYYGEEPRIDALIGDESCSYVMRDVDHRHLGALPTMIRKVLNVRESLDRQNAHLQISERRYLELVGALPDIVYTLDPSGNFIYINSSVESLGFRPEELLGQHFSAIVDEADVPKVSRSHVLPRLKDTTPENPPQLFDERRTGSRMTRNLEIRLRVKPALGADAATASVLAFGEVSSVGFSLPEYDGQGIGTVGIIRDVTLRRHTEEQLREAVRVKEVLLKEVHHRVKNNLQIVSSLLNLQAAAIEDETALSVFRDSQSQIQSMAIVHEHLYRSENLQTISMDRFLNTLVRHLFHVWDIGEGAIAVDFSIEALSLGIDQAMPIALIVNELISNAIKHGTQREGARIRVQLVRRNDDEFALTVADNGDGLPPDFSKKAQETLGFQIIQSLVQQLDARLEISTDEGASFTIVFVPDAGRRSFDTKSG